MTETTDKISIPLHQWTHTGDHVLMVKCLNRDGTTHGGFRWPESGPVAPEKWSREPTCDSGGLFGWPWGVFIDDGRHPDACAEWLVFAAKPENVIALPGAKAKAVPSDGGELPEVVYRGSMAGAIAYTIEGAIAWIASNSSSASTSGDYSSASTSGYSSSASTSGYSSSASTSGNSSSASTSGYRSSASTSGECSIACCTGDYTTIEIGEHAIGAATGEHVKWLIHVGAKLCVGWFDKDKTWHARLFDSAKLNLSDGDVIYIRRGRIVKQDW